MGKELGGVEVKVNTAKPYDFQFGDSRTIKMSNLSRKVTEQHILNHFKKHSEIKNPPISISLRHHPSNEDKMGFALIELQSKEDALKVIQNVTMTELEGTKCIVEMAYNPNRDRNESQRGKTQRVILGNLHYKLGIAEITEMCKEYGTVKGVNVKSNVEGYPQCTAFVEMADSEEASALFDGLNGKKVNNLVIRTRFWFQKPAARGSRVGGRGRGRGSGRSHRVGGSKKVTAKQKLKGSAFSGKKKMENAKNRLTAAKAKGKGQKQKKKAMKQG